MDPERNQRKEDERPKAKAKTKHSKGEIKTGIDVEEEKLEEEKRGRQEKLGFSRIWPLRPQAGGEKQGSAKTLERGGDDFLFEGH